MSTPKKPPSVTSGPKGSVLRRGVAPEDLAVAGGEAIHPAVQIGEEKRVVHHGGQKIVDPVPEKRAW